jgi:hypothetical protein
MWELIVFFDLFYYWKIFRNWWYFHIYAWNIRVMDHGYSLFFFYKMDHGYCLCFYCSLTKDQLFLNIHAFIRRDLTLISQILYLLYIIREDYFIFLFCHVASSQQPCSHSILALNAIMYFFFGFQNAIMYFFLKYLNRPIWHLLCSLF